MKDFQAYFSFLGSCMLMAFLFSNNAFAQDIDHWETIVETGQTVKYLVPEGPLPDDWVEIGFNDADWTVGINGIGYGDKDDNTIDTCLSVYIRNRFSVRDKSAIATLILDMDFDDGFVAYLNGQEISRENMGDPYASTSWDQPSVKQVDEAPIGSYRYPQGEEVIAMLVNGENVLCVEVHNKSVTSSDLSSNTFLHAGISNSTSYFNSTPSWFTAPKNYTSTLPLMIINTNGQDILKDERIVADMGLIYNGHGIKNFPNNSFNMYDGKISIEVRGNTSSNFPKRPYNFELQSDSGTNNNSHLLGLPKENDFVLYGPYKDKTLLRNVLAYEIYTAMGHWAPRNHIIELYLNDDYRGIYVLLEKIKIDKNRLELHELSKDDVDPDDITGGYLLQVDRTRDLDSTEYWTSPVDPLYGRPLNTFEYRDPKIEEMTVAQAEYIKNWVNSFDAVMASSNFKDSIHGYRAYIDPGSFADYLILHELNKDYDAFRLSTYFHKASDKRGGKLHAGPPWDYNLAFGNVKTDHSKFLADGWLYPSASRYWWTRLMEDPWFENQVICRYNALRKSILSDSDIHAILDSCIHVMGTSIEHNFDRWKLFEEDKWPSYYSGENYEEEVEFLKTWLSERLDWIDSMWGGQCIATKEDQHLLSELTTLSISPNPSSLSHTRVRVPNHHPGRYELRLYDVQGKVVFSSSHELGDYSSSIFLDDLSYLEQGIYMLVVQGNGRSYSAKLVRE